MCFSVLDENAGMFIRCFLLFNGLPIPINHSKAKEMLVYLRRTYPQMRIGSNPVGGQVVITQHSIQPACAFSDTLCTLQSIVVEDMITPTKAQRWGYLGS